MLKKFLRKKWVKIGISLALIVVLFIITGLFAKKNPFPKMDLNTAKAEDIIMVNGESKNKHYDDFPKTIKTTYATIAVPENREKENSSLISLPVKIVHSSSETPKEPIFVLHGRPGASNLRGSRLFWLLENHDLVWVGYRGVDGSVKLDCPEFAKAFPKYKQALDESHLINISKALQKDYKRHTGKGVDIDAYNVIEVIDDIESVRKTLGYKKINLYSASYGTRLAYIYGLKYTENVKRDLQLVVNPPGKFVWEPNDTDTLFNNLGEEWKKDPKCIAKSPDIIATMQNVFSQLPTKWRRIEIDQRKVKFVTFAFSYTRNGFAQVFDAFVAAENGDFSGLAFMCMAFDQYRELLGDGAFGDLLSKGLSADYERKRDYINEMEPEGSLIGSQMSRLLFSIGKYGGWKMKMIPEEYRKMQTSTTETLLLSGSIDISTPDKYATELLDYLPNGHQVIFENRGHQDVGDLQTEEFRQLINTFYHTGEVQAENIKNIPIDFDDPKPSLQKLGKIFRFLKRIGLDGFVVRMMF